MQYQRYQNMCLYLYVMLSMIDRKINFKPVHEVTGVDVSLKDLLYIEPPCP